MNDFSDSEIVQSIADSLIGEIDKPGNPADTTELQLFYDVYSLDLETGSAASFDQYFYWSTKEQVERIYLQLEEIGLSDLAQTVSKAIQIAFPNGVPEDPGAYENCTEWSEEQDEALSYWYEKEKMIHPDIEKALANYARKNQLFSG